MPLLTDYAQQLTEMGRGKHFLGDFMPPEELTKFLETFKARGLFRLVHYQLTSTYRSEHIT